MFAKLNKGVVVVRALLLCINSPAVVMHLSMTSSFL